MQPYHILVNKKKRLGREDVPADLVCPKIFFPAGTKKQRLRREAAENIEHMFYSARREGIYLAGISGYRSYERQEELYQDSIRKRGREYTEKYIAPPGGSEHQTGLAMDISCKSEDYQLEESFAESREGIWLAQNAGLFGFIIRYPKGKENITGYAYEPWHIRYVTQALACSLSRLGLTLEEYYAGADTIEDTIEPEEIKL